jgi:hypothetical protein
MIGQTRQWGQSAGEEEEGHMDEKEEGHMDEKEEGHMHEKRRVTWMRHTCGQII